MLRRYFVVFILISTLAVAGCKISGTITKEDESGAGGVIVYLAGEGEDGVGSIMAITDADGNYAFEGFHHGTLTITPDPESAEYTFVPPSKPLTVDFFANAVVNFTATERSKEKDQDPSEMSYVPWSTFQGNASHTGYVPVYLNTNEFFESWTRNIFEVAGFDPDMLEDTALNPVTAGDGKVFVTTDGDYGPHLAIALYSVDGEPVWTDGPYDFVDVDYIGPPAYANGLVYIQSVGYGNDPSFLWALDASSGNIKFDSARYDNQGGRFYAPTVYVDEAGDDIDAAADDNENIGVYIAGGYYDDSSYFGSVYGFNGVTGEKLWNQVPALTPYEQWTPAVNKEYVIVYTGPYGNTTNFEELTVFDRLTGEMKFTIPDPNFDKNEPPNEFSGFNMNLAPVLGSDKNVIAIQSGRLIYFDFDLDLMGPIWEIDKKDGDEEGFIGQPSVANGIIYAVYEGSLHAIDESDGSFIEEWLPWQPPSGESIVTPMLVTDNLIFVSTESATYAVDLENQTDAWDYPAGGHLALSGDGMLFIATPEGELHAISTVATE